MKISSKNKMEKEIIPLFEKRFKTQIWEQKIYFDEDVKEAIKNLKKELKKVHVVRLEGHITPDYKEGFWEGVNFMRNKTDKAFEKHIGEKK